MHGKKHELSTNYPPFTEVVFLSAPRSSTGFFFSGVGHVNHRHPCPGIKSRAYFIRSNDSDPGKPAQKGYIPVPGYVPTIGFGTTEGVMKTGKPACVLECSCS